MPNQFFSTFVYRNHWSAFAILGASCAAGVAFAAWDHIQQGEEERNRSARAIRLFGFCATALILITPALPGSRSGTVMAGLLTCVIAGSVLAKMPSSVTGPTRQRLLLTATLLAIATIAAWSFWLSKDSLDDNWRRTAQEWRSVEEKGAWNPRVYTARDTWRMVLVRPWFGWGAGCFEPVFPLYEGSELRDTNGFVLARWEHAHCDWLEIPAEFGFVGLGLLLVTIYFCIRRLFRYGGIWSRWVLCGLVIVAVYAMAEFPFHNPAVLIFWAVLLGSCSARIRDNRTHVPGRNLTRLNRTDSKSSILPGPLTLPKRSTSACVRTAYDRPD